MTQATLSSHVLDLDAGAPAAGLKVTLLHGDDAARELACATTDADGRIPDWPGIAGLPVGRYALVFETCDWYAARGVECFYPRIRVEFQITGSQPHYHVPLLLNRHGYTTYRGS
jgi:5-hydroxyisourate hydrolase